jgi:MFS family permease
LGGTMVIRRYGLASLILSVLHRSNIWIKQTLVSNIVATCSMIPANYQLDNAYVSGLSDDLNFHGNELVHLQTIYSLGAVLGQLPFALLFPKVRMNYLVPALDILWGLFTLLQYRASSYSEMMAYRFLVGLFESAYFPAVHYVLGSWYRGDRPAG